MSGFGVPVKVEGLTDVNQNLINIQRSLSDLFSKISEVAITTSLVIDAEPFLNPASIGPSGTITAAPMASTGLLGGQGGVVASVVHIGTGLNLDAGNTLTATGGGGGGGGSVTHIDTTGPGITGGPITTTGTLGVQWNAGQVNGITNRLSVAGGSLDVVQVQGTNSNGNAASGIVGEFIFSTVAAGIAMSSAVATVVTSINLSPGDWDVSGNVVFEAGAGATITQETAAISPSTPTMPPPPGLGGYTQFSVDFVAGGRNAFPVGSVRVALSALTTVYLMASANFTGSMGVYGFIGARRRR